jgi:hypothetical protein
MRTSQEADSDRLHLPRQTRFRRGFGDFVVTAEDNRTLLGVSPSKRTRRGTNSVIIEAEQLRHLQPLGLICKWVKQKRTLNSITRI